MKILLIIDNKTTRKQCQIIVEQLNCDLFTSNSNSEIDDIIIRDGYDLIIIDRDLDQDSFFSVIKIVREYDSSTPVIIINCNNDPEELTNLYSLKIIDCIKKPFIDVEIKIKIENFFEKNIDKIIYFNDSFFYNMNSKQFYYQNTPIVLTKQESLLCFILIKNINTTVSHDRLLDFVFNNEVEDLYYSRHLVSRVRKKLPLNIIETIPGRGYKISCR